MRMAFLGTRGVPARYGGFETAVEEIGARLAARGHDVIVYCRGSHGHPRWHLGMHCVHLPALPSRTLETPSHMALSSADLLRRSVDCAVVMNAANAPFLPLLHSRRIPVATHVDGLEWRRDKWGPRGRSFYRRAESLAVRWSDALIADAAGIQDYYAQVFHAPTELIAYGARTLPPDTRLLPRVGLAPGGYHLVVARMEPENHVELMVEGYLRSGASLPLVVVGSVPYATDYSRRVHELAAGSWSVRLLGGVWDQELLDQLYVGCASYLHGHSVGGTNPSLLRAMGAGAPVISYDVVFNHEVVGAWARYVRDPEDVAAALLEVEHDPEGARRRGRGGRTRVERLYDWDEVADAYERLCDALVRRALPAGGRRPSGHRFAEWDGPSEELAHAVLADERSAEQDDADVGGAGRAAVTTEPEDEEAVLDLRSRRPFGLRRPARGRAS